MLVLNDQIYLVLLLFLVVSMLYSSIGHAGASGYLAILSLLSFSTELIKPVSLVLNCIVAAITSYHFIKEGHFDKRIFIPFIIVSFPMAFLGGTIELPTTVYKITAGVFLILSALMLLLKNNIVKNKPSEIATEIPLYKALGIGVVIGFFSGLIGVGGGVFLSPILILLGWASIKKTAGIASLFILCNSIAGLVGHSTVVQKFDYTIFILIIPVVIGGFIGSYFGAKKLTPAWISILLSIVLIAAGIKFILVK